MSIIVSFFAKIIRTFTDIANKIRKKLFQEYIEENKMTLFEMPEKIDQIVAVSGFEPGTELSTYKNSTYTYLNITSQFSIPSGAYNANNHIHILNSTNIKASNIKHGISFGGILGNYTYLKSGGIYSGVVLTNYTGFVNNSTVYGAMPNRGAPTVAKYNFTQTLLAGYYTRIVIPPFLTVTSRTTSTINSTSKIITATSTAYTSSYYSTYITSAYAMMNMASFNLDPSGYAPSNVISTSLSFSTRLTKYIGASISSGGKYQIKIVSPEFYGSYYYLYLLNAANTILTSNTSWGSTKTLTYQMKSGVTYVIKMYNYLGYTQPITTFQFTRMN